jgi:hypothetical protein
MPVKRKTTGLAGGCLFLPERRRIGDRFGTRFFGFAVTGSIAFGLKLW